MLDQERKDFGPDYHDDGWLFCWENGKPPHPDTITPGSNGLPSLPDCQKSTFIMARNSYAAACGSLAAGRASPDIAGR